MIRCRTRGMALASTFDSVENSMDPVDAAPRPEGWELLMNKSVKSVWVEFGAVITRAPVGN